MKIGIDARMYSQSGIGRYTRNLIEQLQKQDTKNEYFIFLQKAEFDSINLKENFKKVLADFSWYGITEQLKMPKLLNQYKLDLVHFPHFNVPVLYSGKFVVTIHDLIHQNFSMQRASTHGKLIYQFKQFGYKAVLQNALLRSKKILVPSEYVKNQLGDKGVNLEKVLVTPEAVDHGVLNLSKRLTKEKSLKIIQGFGINGPYLFYVGNAHPHKNAEGLLEVFWKLQDKYKQLNLVLSGGDHYFWNRIKDAVSTRPNSEKVIFTGFITDEQLVALYKNAVCFTSASLEEGFGIPILEAFACSCPVVASNAGSIPEVGGEAALYFDPKNQSEMFEKIEDVLNSEKVRQELIKKGLKRYAEFSWENLAKETLEVYRLV